MSSVVMRIVDESGDKANPDLVFEVTGDVKGEFRLKLDDVFNEIDPMGLVVNCLRLAAHGRNRKNFLHLFQKKAGVGINI